MNKLLNTAVLVWVILLSLLSLPLLVAAFSVGVVTDLIRAAFVRGYNGLDVTRESRYLED